jgi:hypothetical protein
MSWLQRRRFLVDYVGAAVFPGGQDAKPDLTDKFHVGLLELTESLRWVPEKGEGWSFPIAQIGILSPPASANERTDGILLSLAGVDTVRVRGTIPVGVYPITTTREIAASSAETERLRGELLRRGAVDAAASAGGRRDQAS